MSTNDNTSTLKAAYDSVTGAAQNVLGNLTGSTGDQVQGQAKQDKASAEHESSQATLKIPGFTASSSGAVTKDNSDRTTGSINQGAGAFKESLGHAVGSDSLVASGRQQNEEGQAQEKVGQADDFSKGLMDRVGGTVGAAVSGVTGNTKAQQDYQDQHDAGKTQQRGAEHDIQKQADAEYNASQRPV
ncbi:hypothetical protein GGR57DRAFT_479675 [Xylariaceae sp. FL1272]|nr:hypothetical protein GGR57DRAFT_479675 [Xylariaceae sp. FL1272]